MNAGFSSGSPWLPVADHNRECNVEAESRDAASLLVVYRELLGLRKAHSALNFGGYRPVQLLYSTTPGRAVGVQSGHLARAPHEGIILSLDTELV